jgi:hypothetical protein
MSKEEETNTTSNIPLDSQTKQTVQKIPLLKTGFKDKFLKFSKMQVFIFFIFIFGQAQEIQIGKVD